MRMPRWPQVAQRKTDGRLKRLVKKKGQKLVEGKWKSNWATSKKNLGVWRYTVSNRMGLE